jgi:hypothetical protein
MSVAGTVGTATRPAASAVRVAINPALTAGVGLAGGATAADGRAEVAMEAADLEEEVEVGLAAGLGGAG